MEGRTEGRKKVVPCSTHTYISDNEYVTIRAKNGKKVEWGIENSVR